MIFADLPATGKIDSTAEQFHSLDGQGLRPLLQVMGRVRQQKQTRGVDKRTIYGTLVLNERRGHKA